MFFAPLTLFSPCIERLHEGFDVERLDQTIDHRPDHAPVLILAKPSDFGGVLFRRAVDLAEISLARSNFAEGP
ncbi:MAG: hypothetical protein ACE5DK_13335, partial [Paracoccaceae bacterium]